MKALFFFISICISSAIQTYGEPMVAFVCNKPAMYLNSNGWQRVEDVDCMHQPVDILNFCRRVYPGVDVTNVVESSVKVTIGNWCQVDKPNCRHPEHTVTPYKCVVGSFHSEALLVPEHCVFDHLHDQSRCQSNLGWRQVAENACISRGLTIESSAPLSVCGIDKFQGVEYVCCPMPKQTVKNGEKNTADKVVPKKTAVEEKNVSEEESDDDADEEEEASEEQTGNYYSRYLHKIGSELLGEHEFFVRARADINKQHQDKTNKLMADWNAAKKHVDDVKKLDPKGGDNLSKEISERFQKTYDALDQEQLAETRQLMAIHEERVQAALNKKREDAVNHFHTLLNTPVQESDVVDALKRYIRIEQKIRLHDVNRYEHLADRDPAEADSVRQQIIDHLHLVDVRILDTLDLLSRVPQWEKKIRIQMDEFVKSFHDIDAGVAGILAEQVEAQLRANPLPPAAAARVQSEEEEKSEEKSVEEPSVESAGVMEEKELSQAKEDKSNPISASVEDSEAVDTTDDDSHMLLPLDQFTEPEFDIAEEVKISHLEANGLEAEQMKKVKKSVHSSLGHGAAVGIAVGTVTVFIVLVIGLAIIRRRPYDVTVSHAVDDNATAEDSHVSKMQANGYENPTYKYFEMRTDTRA